MQPSILAIIPRSPHMPPIRVLEVDGPRRKHCQRGEGSYYLATDNQPPIYDFMNPGSETVDTSRFKPWGKPCWTIYQHHNGTFEITASRPTGREASEGDLHGRWGSRIILAFPTRQAVRNGLRLARRLCRCRTSGVVVNRRHLDGIALIETDIRIRL